VTSPDGTARGLRGGLSRGILAIVLPALLAPVLVAGAAGVLAAAGGPLHVRIEIEHSHFIPAAFNVTVGRPVVIELHNADPIDHEWIVGDEATHLRHATGTEPHHGSRPTEVSIDAQSTVTTTITFTTPGSFRYVYHLPGHEAYGMVGTVTVTP
jgi:uncharacterized cupredoxin-like copper-binding protein